MNNENEEPCDCGVISAMLNDPTSGLTLGEDNTFLLAGQWCVYHCPFCGGLLPHSRKPIWYPRLTDDERARLQQLVEGIATAEEAIRRLGPPDYDALIDVYESINDSLVHNEELSTKCRNVEYYNLSEHANIEFYFHVDYGVEYRLEIKPISPHHVRK